MAVARLFAAGWLQSSTVRICWLLITAAGCSCLNSESGLQDAWLAAITGKSHIESGGPISYDFTQGRATNYAYNQAGSCGYGPIFEDESLGQPLHVLAIPDCSPLFPGIASHCSQMLLLQQYLLSWTALQPCLTP